MKKEEQSYLILGIGIGIVIGLTITMILFTTMG